MYISISLFILFCSSLMNHRWIAILVSIPSDISKCNLIVFFFFFLSVSNRFIQDVEVDEEWTEIHEQNICQQCWSSFFIDSMSNKLSQPAKDIDSQSNLVEISTKCTICRIFLSLNDCFVGVDTEHGVGEAK